MSNVYLCNGTKVKATDFDLNSADTYKLNLMQFIVSAKDVSCPGLRYAAVVFCKSLPI